MVVFLADGGRDLLGAGHLDILGAALGRVLEAHLRNKCETVKESFLAKPDKEPGHESP